MLLHSKNKSCVYRIFKPSIILQGLSNTKQITIIYHYKSILFILGHMANRLQLIQ